MLALKNPPPPQPDSVAHLREVVLFADIKDIPGALERLASAMVLRDYTPGTDILREGDTGSDMFLLVDGEASVHKRTPDGDTYKVVILSGKSHAFFGEGGLLDNDARSATIRAETKCRCLVLDRPAFEAFSGQNPQWAIPILLRIARGVLARLKKTNNDLMLLYNALIDEIRGH